MYFILSLNDFEMFVAPSQEDVFVKIVWCLLTYKNLKYFSQLGFEYTVKVLSKRTYNQCYWKYQ